MRLQTADEGSRTRTPPRSRVVAWSNAVSAIQPSKQSSVESPKIG